jgi:hypothetical protein
MAVAKCPRCGAVVTARLIGGEIKVSQGASFLSTCTQIKDRLAAGQVCVATECDVMEIAVQRVGRRARASHASYLRKKAAAITEASVSAEPDGDAGAHLPPPQTRSRQPPQATIAAKDQPHRG